MCMYMHMCMSPTSVSWQDLARTDQLCGLSPNGLSSGADGQKCMTMNSTQFLEHGGAACLMPTALTDQPRYQADPSLPGCLEAFASYRQATSPSFTCDCNGDNAALGGTNGLRSGVVFTISNIISTVFIVLLAPALGTWIDHVGGKKLWVFLITIAGMGAIGQAVLGPNMIWLVGLIISLVTITASEVMTIPRQTYLIDLKSPTPEVENADDVFQAQISAQRIIWSYASQIVFVVIALPLTFVLPTTTSCQIITILAGVWSLGHFAFLVPKFPSRPAARSLNGRSATAIAWGQLRSDLVDISRDYPEALKYLLFLFVVQNGLGTTSLSIASSYLLDQLKFSAFQQNIFFVITLICGFFWLLLLQKLLAKPWFTYKKLMVIVICIWMFAILMIGLVITGMGEVGGRWNTGYYIFLATGAFVLAPGLTWYYALYWPTFMCLVPKAQVNQFGGIFTLVRTVGLLPQPIVYVACSIAFSSAWTGRQVGLLTMMIWDVLAIPLILWIDFEKGRKDAAKAGESGAKAVEMSVASSGQATSSA